MRKLAMLFVFVLVILGTEEIANAQEKSHPKNTASEVIDSLAFWGQVVGAYADHQSPEYKIEGGLDYAYNSKLGGFSFFSVGAESTATIIGGPTFSPKRFPWIKVGVGGGLDQTPKSLVGAGMIRIGDCSWHILGFGWIGKEKFYDWWVEGFVDTGYYFVFGTTARRFEGLGVYGGVRIPESPAEIRAGARFASAIYPGIETTDPTYFSTLYLGIPW